MCVPCASHVPLGTEFAITPPMNPRHLPSFARRALLASAALCISLPALAQTPIKFQLDWRFEGPAALFLASAAKGYYKDAKLDVTIDAGSGSGAAVTRVASGAYDMGFADMAALMEFHANKIGRAHV